MLQRLASRRRPPEPRVPPGTRLYAIGDIHGRLDLFEALLTRVREDDAARGEAETLVILLGDLIDRGPDSAGVVRRAMAPLGWARTLAIKGNHEAAMLDAIDGDRTMLGVWLDNGGEAALRSWGVPEPIIATGTSEQITAAVHAAVPRAERLWLAAMRQCVHIGDYYFVHAGVRPGVALERQTAQDSQWIRKPFLESRRAHGAMIVHGHSVATEVEQRPNRIGIDTGAYATGRLTALGLEAEKRWLVQT